MSEEPINLLKVASDLAQFRETLEHVARFPEQYGGSAEAAALLAVLDSLAAGQEPTRAIVAGMRAYEETSHQLADRERSRQRASDASYQARMVEEETTRKVECPYCGAAPRTKCRTVGPVRNIRTDSHRDRYQAARGLLEPGRLEQPP